MDQLQPLGTTITDIIMPTAKIFAPLLLAKSHDIHSTPRTEHSYGSHPRQKLDLYVPAGSDPKTSTRPILIFFYGGGFVRGSKSFNLVPGDDLIYANLGHFFVQQGFDVVIGDYRLAGPASMGAHNSVFPQSSEDVAAVVEWAGENLTSQENRRDAFLMGASAGGAHSATFMLHPSFAAVRAAITGPDASMRLRGVSFVSGMLSLNLDLMAHPPASLMKPGAAAYYGKDEGKWEARGPSGLLTAEEIAHAAVPTLALVATLDPPLILEANDVFRQNWDAEKVGVPLEQRLIHGHNHTSSLQGLGTGMEREEAWGVEVVKWMKALL